MLHHLVPDEVEPDSLRGQPRLLRAANGARQLAVAGDPRRPARPRRRADRALECRSASPPGLDLDDLTGTHRRRPAPGHDGRALAGAGAWLRWRTGSSGPAARRSPTAAAVERPSRSACATGGRHSGSSSDLEHGSDRHSRITAEAGERGMGGGGPDERSARGNRLQSCGKAGPGDCGGAGEGARGGCGRDTCRRGHRRDAARPRGCGGRAVAGRCQVTWSNDLSRRARPITVVALVIGARGIPTGSAAAWRDGRLGRDIGAQAGCRGAAQR